LTLQFYETVAGRRFFDSQIPKLIAALQKISEGLTRPTSGALPLADPPAALLHDLYNGEYDLSDPPHSQEYAALTKQIVACQKRLAADAGPALWEQIDQNFSLLITRSCMEQEHAFSTGYRCAFQLIAAGLTPPLSPAQTKHEKEADGHAL
jgi:hypothetical protein